ncbi:MAG TPA: 2-phospho-L-lactate transferase [Candidatus Dormibacteraeota bacterium]
MRTVVLAGGTGGAKLAAGFQSMLPPGDLAVIANTADDDEFWGLLVSPDVDATIYRLAGVFDESVGYGQKGDTFLTLEALGRLGEPTWFRIGDRDLATHVLRSQMLNSGCRLTETSLELCRRFGLASHVLPMTDDKVRTRFVTDRGTLSFQEYFVRERLAPALHSIDIAGADAAESTPEATAALVDADLVVIGPSNPLISIEPILKVIGGQLHRERTVAVTPIVGGAALKGPTVEMLRALGFDASPLEVARRYAHVAGMFVLDNRDKGVAREIEAMGYRAILCDTVMADGGAALAKAISAAF